MADWPLDERPRERLLDKGAGALSDSELIALVLRTGSGGGATAVDEARQLIAAFGGVSAVGRATVSELRRHRGMGLARAAAVVAAFELGRRVAGSRIENGVAFRTSREIFDHFRGRLSPLVKEVFSVVLLDAKHRKLREAQISEGSLTSSIVHPREVFSAAVRESAAAVVLVHNHPSGDPTPSAEDVEITRRLRAAGDVLGIRVLDHVIVARERHFSFVDAGYW